MTHSASGPGPVVNGRGREGRGAPRKWYEPKEPRAVVPESLDFGTVGWKPGGTGGRRCGRRVCLSDGVVVRAGKQINCTHNDTSAIPHRAAAVDRQVVKRNGDRHAI